MQQYLEIKSKKMHCCVNYGSNLSP